MANEKFTNALRGIAQNCPPVWLMRQAGRYHGHYQNLRKQHSFIELCKQPDLAAEVALGPVADFDFDVSILFSDLLFPLEALGMGLKYEPAPALGWHLTSANDLRKMRTLDQAVAELAFQKEALIATRKVLPVEKSLIGFVGSPWTLFVYAVCGSHQGQLLAAKTDPHLFSRFCEVMVPLLKKNIELQLAGGAEIVMLFDTAAGELSPWSFNSWVVPHLKDLAQTFPGQLAYYSKGTQAAHLLSLWGATPFAGYGYDHRWHLPGTFGNHQGFVQGNFDQAMLFLKPEDFVTEFRAYLSAFKGLKPTQRLGWVCGLGHGVLPETPVANVRNFVKIVREVF